MKPTNADQMGGKSGKTFMGEDKSPIPSQDKKIDCENPTD